MSVNNSAVNRRGGEEGDGGPGRGGTAEVISLSRRILIIIDPSVGPRCLNYRAASESEEPPPPQNKPLGVKFGRKYFEELSQTARRASLILLVNSVNSVNS